MPPKKTKKATKPKKAKGKTKTRMSQVQTTRVNVRVAGGPGGPSGAGEGGGAAGGGAFLASQWGLGQRTRLLPRRWDTGRNFRRHHTRRLRSNLRRSIENLKTIFQLGFPTFPAALLDRSPRAIWGSKHLQISIP